jgi:uncharacterized C2H2 Zn-finger protein
MEHVDDELLELYAVGRVFDSQQRVSLEEHLLLCVSCQDQLREHKDYIRCVRAALEHLADRARHRYGLTISVVLGPNDESASSCSAAGAFHKCCHSPLRLRTR